MRISGGIAAAVGNSRSTSAGSIVSSWPSAAQVPAVDHEVGADDAVDVLLDRHPPHRRLTLRRGDERVGEQRLDVGEADR